MPEVSSVAVIDLDARTREKIVASFPASTPYQDLDAALPHVDAVIVASPPHTHCDVALKCLRARKHVLLEKPIAKSMSEALLLVDEARRSNLILMPGHTFEFNPAVQRTQAADCGEESSATSITSTLLGSIWVLTGLMLMLSGISPHMTSRL